MPDRLVNFLLQECYVYILWAFIPKKIADNPLRSLETQVLLQPNLCVIVVIVASMLVDGPTVETFVSAKGISRRFSGCK